MNSRTKVESATPAAPIDKQPVHQAEEIVAGGAFDRPVGAQFFVPDQNFLGDDVERLRCVSVRRAGGL